MFGFKGVFHLKRSYFGVKYPFKFKDETHFVSLAAAARSAGEAPPHSSSPLKEKDNKLCHKVAMKIIFSLSFSRVKTDKHLLSQLKADAFITVLETLSSQNSTMV